ncbi:MAG: YtxH domain-containing protein [Gemmatimonadota bacterium]|nr:YtxH domain-containing protein [Gemmatimonadota bacterium]
MARSADFAGTQSEIADSERGVDKPFPPEDMAPARLPARPLGKSYEHEADGRRFGTLAVGLAIGVAVGAGIALLMAPMSGSEVREAIGDRARGLRGQAADSWDELRDELRYASHRGGRGVRRGVTRGRWAVEDLADRTRR